MEVFQSPLVVSNKRDLKKLKTKLKKVNFLEHALLNRPNSRYKPIMVTNLKFTVTKTNFPLGCSEVEIPSWLYHRKGLYRDAKNKDNLCMLRALAQQRLGRKLVPYVMLKSLFYQWLSYCTRVGIKISKCIDKFKGIDMRHLLHFEKCFQINVNIFELQENGQTLPVFKSMGRYKTTLYLNKFCNHVSYIYDIKLYCNKYKCITCQTLCKTQFQLSTHRKRCLKQSNLQYPSGFVSQNLSIFEKLEHYGVFVNPDDRFYTWKFVYDFECILEKLPSDKTAQTELTHRHIPVSWAAVSDVDGFIEPVCEVSSDPDDLIHKLVQYMYKVQVKAKELAMQKWGDALQKLDSLIEHYKPKADNLKTKDDNNDDDDGDDMSPDQPDEPMSQKMIERMIKPNVYTQMMQNLHKNDVIDVQYNEYVSDSESDDDDDEIFTTNHNNTITYENIVEKDMNEGYLQFTERLKKVHYNKLQRLRKEFDKYITELICIGFNNSNYDSLIGFSSFFTHLDIPNCKQPFIIKKNNTYQVISNGVVRIVDVSRWLAQGTSLDQFLRSYEAPANKAFFCYEFMDSLDKLKFQGLPAVEHWYSTLKNRNILGKDQAEINKNYQWLQDIWKEHKMSTLQDLLIWYNILDVKPLLAATDNLFNYYKNDHNIDMFKETVSSPGVSRLLIMRSAFKNGATFYQFNKSQANIYRMFANQITGGPSVIFTRKLLVGTEMRENTGELCRSICGMDCNSLYPFSYKFHFPQGAPIIRWRHTNFYPETNQRYTSMYDFMDYMAFKTKLNIQHACNSKTEVLIGAHPTDGYAVDNVGNRFSFEYDSCWYHGCDLKGCKSLSVKTRIKYKKLLDERRHRTEMRNDYIRSHGVTLCIMKECVWQNLIQTNSEVKQFVLSRKPQFYASHPKQVTEDQILSAVLEKKLFGFVMVDIHCPKEWNDRFKSEYSPGIFFSEYPPLWLSCLVDYDKWGKVTQDFAKKAGLSLKPRKLLVGSTKGERLLLLTDLLEW